MEVKGYFGHEIEKFLLKLEILRLKFGIKKFEIKEGFRSEIATVRKSIESFRENAKKLKALPAAAYDDIKTEISSNYKSLRNAIKKL
jgi:predicted transcriptional regulator